MRTYRRSARTLSYPRRRRICGGREFKTRAHRAERRDARGLVRASVGEAFEQLREEADERWLIEAEEREVEIDRLLGLLAFEEAVELETLRLLAMPEDERNDFLAKRIAEEAEELAEAESRAESRAEWRRERALRDRMVRLNIPVAS